jgi:hypothetical protein
MVQLWMASGLAGFSFGLLQLWTASALAGFSFELLQHWDAVEAGVAHASFPWHGGAWDECLKSPRACRTRSAKLGLAEMDRYKSKQISVNDRS